MMGHDGLLMISTFWTVVFDTFKTVSTDAL